MSMKLKKQVKQLLADDTSQATDLTNIKAAIGTDDTTAGGLKKRCKDIETAIGDDETAASIKGRLYALEHPVTQNDGGGTT